MSDRGALSKAKQLLHNPFAETAPARAPVVWRRGRRGGRLATLGWGTELFTGGGEMATRLGAFDWAAHPLGRPETWPGALKAALGICLRSTVPTAVYWGPELRLLYNDAWSPMLADRRSWALGQPAAEVWSDIWPVIGPQFANVVASGRGFSTHDQLLAMRRGSFVEETYWDYSFTPILGDDGRVAGVLNQGLETTERVLTARSQAFLLELGDRLRDLASGDHRASAALATVLEALGTQLGLARAGYAEVTPEAATATIRGEWRGERAPATPAGSCPLADFGGVFAEATAGRTAAVEDVVGDPRIAEAEAGRILALGVRSMLLAPVVRGGRAIALIFLNDDRPRRWTRPQLDLAREAAERIWVALDRADAAARMRESERRFTTIFGQAGVGLCEVDAAGRFLRINDSMGRILGRAPETIAGVSIAEVTHPDDIADTRREVAATRDSGDPFVLEKRYVKPDGSTTWTETHVTHLLDEAGRTGSYFSVVTDVSERKEQERLRAWLIAELNHRVKNNLSTVQALVRQTMESAATLEDFESVFNARLMALSRAHDLLMRETWTSAALGDLVAGTLAPYAREGGERFEIVGPEVRLSPTAAVTLTLAFHELATNAAKFGALSRPEGRVAVAWSVDPARDGGAIELEWRESNGPPVFPPQRRGFGLRLIERGATRELGGSARLDFSPQGVACAFQFPLSQKVMLP